MFSLRHKVTSSSQLSRSSVGSATKVRTACSKVEEGRIQE